jgi:hypothetical protein
MSISITKQPQDYNLAVGKNIWTFSGATQSNQFYLSAVRIKGITASTYESPRNPAGVAHIDVSNIIKSKLSPENIETINTFSNAISMITDYRINYGSQIGLTQSFTNLSNIKFVLNGWKPENIIDWDYTAFLPFSVIYNSCENLNDRIRFSTKFKQLSNYPTKNNIPEYKIQNNEYQTQTIFNVISQSSEVSQFDGLNIAPSFVKWEFFDENNTILKDYIYPINLTNGAGPWDDECTIGTQSTLERILHIPSGTQNLKNAGIFPTGLTASLVKSYKISVWTRDVCQNCPPGEPTTTTTTTSTSTTTTTSTSTTTTTSTTTEAPVELFSRYYIGGNWNFYDNQGVHLSVGLEDDFSIYQTYNNNRPVFNDRVFSINTDTEGNLYIGGWFIQDNSDQQPIPQLCVVSKDGFRDNTFISNMGTGTNLGQFEGRIPFTRIHNNIFAPTDGTWNGSAAPLIIKMNLDGTLDNNWVAEPAGTVKAIKPIGDSDYIMCGVFESWGTENIKYLIRTNIDGVYNNNYNFDFNGGGVADFIIEQDGSIIVGGGFIEGGGQGDLSTRIGKLNPDWTSNNQFNLNIKNAGAPDNGVDRLVKVSDGYLIIGNFNQIFSTGRNQIAKVLFDGTPDTNFNNNLPNFNNRVRDAIFDDINNIIVIVGHFTSPTNRIYAINLDGSANETAQNNIGDGFNSDSYTISLYKYN